MRNHFHYFKCVWKYTYKTQMCVVNGRFNPDKDNFTSISTKGSAVVDYFLTNHRKSHKISDHSMLVIDILTRDADV